MLTLVVAGASVVLASCGDVASEQTGGSTVAPGPTEAVEVPATTSPPPSTTPSTRPPSSTTTTAAAPSSTVAASTVRVVAVIDGDTIDVAALGRVRLIGIDAPERGECGHGEATMVLASLVWDRDVQLVPGARDDSDRYGRLLRYVEVGGVDANLEMIRSGRAIARYDSRDGYGRHAREDVYVRADALSPNVNDCATPTTLAPPAAPGSGAMDPRFGTCREAIANGYGPYRRGVHVEYGWYRDADADGIVCER